MFRWFAFCTFCFDAADLSWLLAFSILFCSTAHAAPLDDLTRSHVEVGGNAGEVYWQRASFAIHAWCKQPSLPFARLADFRPVLLVSAQQVRSAAFKLCVGGGLLIEALHSVELLAKDYNRAGSSCQRSEAGEATLHEAKESFISHRVFPDVIDNRPIPLPLPVTVAVTVAVVITCGPSA